MINIAFFNAKNELIEILTIAKNVHLTDAQHVGVYGVGLDFQSALIVNL